MTHRGSLRRVAAVLILACLLLAGQGNAQAADLYARAPEPGPMLTLKSAGPSLPTITITVEAGDTIWGYQCQFGVEMADIEAANPGLRMEIGEELVIPLWPLHSVFWAQGGESLVDLAAFTGVALADLMQANALPADAVFEPGQRIWVPEAIPANGWSLREVAVRVGDEVHYYALPPAPLYGRVSLTYGGPEIHRGLDIVAPHGHTIIAPRAGVVTHVGCKDAGDPAGVYGLYMVIAHGNGLEILYAHLSAPLVLEGDTVEIGQPIGRVGTSGRSTGNHLHVETRVYGELVDPLLFFPGVGS